MPIGIDPKVDYAFKYVFGREQNADLLLDLLNAILDPPPDKRLAALTILNPFLPGDTAAGKLAVLDLIAEDSHGKRYNIEMQLYQHPYLKERFLYYWAKLHADQLYKGDEFELLRPTISILLLDKILFPELAGPHQKFQLWNQTHQSPFSDQLEIHLLELPKFLPGLTELSNDLDGWLYFLQHVSELDLKAWPSELKAPSLQLAAKELEMLSLSKIERMRYEARLKGQRDYDTGIHCAKREGLEQGLAQGLEQGREEGREGRKRAAAEACIGMLQDILLLPVTPESELCEMSLSELETLLAELRAKHLSRGNAT